MLVLCFHHILLDGWSMPILLRELFEIYQAARGRAALPPAQPYRDYLAWLATIDRPADEAFWRERLAGLETSCLDLAAGDSVASPDALGEHCVALSDLSTSRLQAVAQAHRLTMSTMVQGVWALVLARQRPHRDVVFGMTTAGRPGDLAGVERMVGLCINTLPRRVRPDSAARVTDWLGDLQARQAEEQTHAWCRLDDIRRWSGAPAGAALFDSVVVFENYPVSTSLARHADAEAPDLAVSAVTSLEQGVHFPLCLVVGPGSRLTFRLAFARRRFAAEAIERLADDLVRLLTALAADPDQRVSALLPVAGRQTTDQTRARVGAEVGAS
jgi:non-ribosomal peptide synthetase component F